MLGLIRRYWGVIRSPSVHFNLGFLTIGGFIGGILFWGAFNTAMEATNTEAFCTGCHEMRTNTFAELKSTIHYTNRSGVRAVCSDCHVPHNWTSKMARKMQASKEVWESCSARSTPGRSSSTCAWNSRSTSGRG